MSLLSQARDGAPGARLGHALLRFALVVAWSLGLNGAAAVPVPNDDLAGQYRPQSWKLEHGLPSDNVRAVIQGRDGHMWVATESGLARFDGRQFTAFTHRNTPGFQRDRCTALAEAPAGCLWVGTRDGLFRLENGVVQPVTVEGKPITQPVSALLADRRGSVWIATWREVYEYHLQQARVVFSRPATGSLGCTFMGLLEDGAGGIWVGAMDGAWHRPAGADGFTRVPGLDLVHGLARSPEGVWLQGEHLAHFEPGRFSIAISGPDQMNRDHVNLGQVLVQDQNRRLWVGGEPEGLFHIENQRPVRFTLPTAEASVRVSALCEDNQGHLWVGTENAGLFCLRPQPFSTLSTNHGLPNGNIQAVLAARDGVIWVGLEQGLVRWREGRFERPEWAAAFASRRVRALHEDCHGTLYAATDRSLFRIHGGQLTSFPELAEARLDKVWSITSDAAGNVWAGCVNGLLHWREGRVRFMTDTNGLPHRDARDVRVVHVDRTGRLWLGTAGGGLGWCRPGTNAAGEAIPGPVTRLTTEQGLADNVVRTLIEDAAGVIWAGTESGLHRVELAGDDATTTRVHRFTIRDGLPDGRVNGLVIDDLGQLWINGLQGLTRVRLSDLNAVAAGVAARADFLTYDEVDGLPTIETSGFRSHPASCRTAEGWLWFATPRGIVRVNPTRLPEASPPVPRLERVVADGQPASAGPDGNPWVSVPPGGLRSLEIHFTAPEFRAPEKLRFQYRLEGIDRNWIDAGTRRAVTYTNLKPGSYRFEVMAARHHGLWSRVPAAFAFRLAPHLWQTWWFWTLFGALAAGGVILAVRWRVGELRRVHALEREAELMRERARIARDMHDDVGARLGQLSLLVEAGGVPPPGVPALRDVVREAAASLDATVWVVQPSQDSLRHLADYLADHAQEFLQAAGLELELDFPPDVPPWPIAADRRRQLFLAAKEALHNVVRHARASRVIVRLALREAEFDLEIADDGCGLPPTLAAQPESGGVGHDGLRNLHRRAEAAGASLRIETATGRGTRLLFTVPRLEPGTGRTR